MDDEEIKAMKAALEDLGEEYRELYTDNHLFIDAEEASTPYQENIPEV